MAELSSAFRWSGISMIGREIARSLFLILVARLVGPSDFGTAAQALVYIGVVSILLDQGFSSALIQRDELDQKLPGAVVTVNILVGATLAGVTIAIAPAWAAFMHAPSLSAVLSVLSASLLFRSLSVTPRAMLIREMEFRRIAIADGLAAVFGGVIGYVVAVLDASYWAVVVQVIGTDIITFAILVVLGARYRPNLQLGELREIAMFSSRSFFAGLLVNSVARNIDNLLVGRFQGANALAFYSLAYRMLLLPVQMASNSVGAVMFPAFSRLASDLPAARREMARATRVLAVVSLPGMALIGVAAPELVAKVFGPSWEPAIPIVQVLAIAGGLQAVYQPSTVPLILGTGRDELILRYAWVTTAFTTIGIVAGLGFGPLGVAVGYSVALIARLPIEWLIRRSILGMSVSAQIRTLWSGCHVAIWMAGSYMVCAAAVQGGWLSLITDLLISLLVGFAVIRLLHRPLWMEMVRITRRLLGRPGSAASPA